MMPQTPEIKTWILEVQQDGEEFFLELPPEALEAAGWAYGDTLIWEELEEGAWSLRKRENLLTRILKVFKLYK